MTTSNDPARKLCANAKRVILAVTNAITIIITAYYLAQSLRHWRVIADNPSVFAPFYTTLDLSQTKKGIALAIARLTYLGLTLLAIPFLPEPGVTLVFLASLAFDVPLALVAQSAFGEQVLNSALDQSPSTAQCYSAAARTSTFWNAYGRIVGKQYYTVCIEFAAEGSRLRSSLLVGWYTIPIGFMLAALFCLCFIPAQKKATDFFVLLTGIDAETFKWRKSSGSSTRMECSGWITWRITVPGLRRRTTSTNMTEVMSDASTLVDEEAVLVKNKDTKTAKDEEKTAFTIGK